MSKRKLPDLSPAPHVTGYGVRMDRDLTQRVRCSRCGCWILDPVARNSKREYLCAFCLRPVALARTRRKGTRR